MRDQIIMRIFTSLLCHCLSTENKGWVAVDEAIWCFQRSTLNLAKNTIWTLQVELLLRVLVQADIILRAQGAPPATDPAHPANEEGRQNLEKPETKRTVRNLFSTVELVEWLLFEYEFSWLDGGGGEDGSTKNTNSGRDMSQSESELASRLLTAFTYSFPLPERRQDILRLLFRFLLVVLPKWGCRTLVMGICDATRLLLTDRMAEKSPKNFRIIELVLHLLKGAMNKYLAHDDLGRAEYIKDLMQDLFDFWGPSVFKESKATAYAGSVDLDCVSPEEIEADRKARLFEELLHHLHQAEFPTQTKSIFIQHQERFALLLNVRLNKMNTIIADYQTRRKDANAKQEQQFLQASENHQSQRGKRLARELTHTASLLDRDLCLRATPKQLKQARRMNKTLKKLFHKFLHSRIEPAVRGSSGTAPCARHRRDRSSDFWKLDPTESPSRMRRLLKKNFKGIIRDFQYFSQVLVHQVLQ